MDSDDHTHVPFGIFLAVYSVTEVGNAFLVMLICNGSWLHTPMYFFIGNLSFLGLSMVYTPKILVTYISEDKSISFAGCLAHKVWIYECYVLAYDCYVSHLKMLLYSQAMSVNLCVVFVAAKYMGDFINFLIIAKKRHLLLTSVVTMSLMTLSIHSIQGCLKPFSTRSSCIISVSLYYGTIHYIYSHTQTSYSLDRDKTVCIFYTVVFPLLTPKICSLRNKNMKEVVNNLLK
uniref:G-protein coupled receptors family 1 profile domain-containing protein n=1 Tax=Nannospalax galili TaxID=1026970 RepID=A0A8C6RTD0_NANGA